MIEFQLQTGSDKTPRSIIHSAKGDVSKSTKVVEFVNLQDFPDSAETILLKGPTANAIG